MIGIVLDNFLYADLTGKIIMRVFILITEKKHDL